MDKWFKDILPDKDPYHNRERDQMKKKGGSEFECLCCKQYYLRGCVTISLEVGTTIAEYSHDLSLFSRSTGYM